MRTVAEGTISRAAQRRRVARARRLEWLRALGSRLRLESPLGVAGVCVTLTVVLGTALFGWQFVPFTLRLTGPFGLSTPTPTTSVDFAEIVFTPLDGNTCRKVLFSNRNGWFGPDQRVRCDTRLPPDHAAVPLPNHGPSVRMNSIRQAFSFRASP